MIRFGIIGLGNIAAKFAQDLTMHPKSKLQAVGSRNGFKAQKFGDKYSATSCYGSYNKVIADEKVDVIYIATPNHLHYELTLKCLEAGKAVICEKPFALNATQVRKMIALAKTRKLFLMEALWTRFIPATQKVLDIINEGKIGQIRSLRADFGFPAPQDPKGRLFNPEMGGGSLLDIGIYPLYLSYLLLGKPESISAEAKMHYTGVDSSCSIELSYEGGQTAILESTFLETTPTEAIIEGSQGGIYMHPRFHHCEKLSIEQNSLLTEVDIPYTGLGYYHQIDEVVKCLEAGKLQSDLMPHKDSLALMELLDAVRSLIGLQF